MTLKAIKQLTNISWIIGGVSAATAGYSYINSRKEQIFVDYTRKPLGKISSVEDIEDYEKQKGCLFLFFTKREVASNKRPDDDGSDGTVSRSVARVQSSTPTPTSPVVQASSANVPSPASVPHSPNHPTHPSIPRYNEWNNGGVLSARNYIDKDEKRREKAIKKAEEMKKHCERGQIIYEAIEDTITPSPKLVNDPQGDQATN